LKLAVFDGERWPEVDGETRGLLDANSIAVVNKSDLGRVRGDVKVGDLKAVVVSAVTGAGIDGLLGIIEQAVKERFADAPAPALTRVRHRMALEECHGALCRYSPGSDVELAAEDLRLAARALGRITGRVDVEEVLDVIFRDFCIGK
jgi:tRNA modification GTPase